jgi:hypothetical protein
VGVLGVGAGPLGWAPVVGGLMVVAAVAAVHAAAVSTPVHRNQQREGGDPHPVGGEEVNHGNHPSSICVFIIGWQPVGAIRCVYGTCASADYGAEAEPSGLGRYDLRQHVVDEAGR